MQSSNKKQTISDGNIVNTKDILSSVPVSNSNISEKLKKEIASTDARKQMDTSLNAPVEQHRQLSKTKAEKMSTGESRTSSSSTVTKTKRVRQSSSLVDEGTSNGNSRSQEKVLKIPPPIYSTNIEGRFAGRSTEIPMHLLRSGKNIVTKTITKRQNENGVTEIHITTVTRKLVDNVPSTDATNRTVVLRTVKKGVSPISTLNINPRPAVDLSFPLEETTSMFSTSGGENNSSNTILDVPEGLENLRPQSISIRTNYREVDLTKPTVVSGKPYVGSNIRRHSLIKTKTTTVASDTTSSRGDTSMRNVETESRKTKSPRVTLPVNFRRKIAVRGKGFDDSIQVPVANTGNVKKSLQEKVQTNLDQRSGEATMGKRKTEGTTETTRSEVKITDNREIFPTETRSQGASAISNANQQSTEPENMKDLVRKSAKDNKREKGIIRGKILKKRKRVNTEPSTNDKTVGQMSENKKGTIPRPSTNAKSTSSNTSRIIIEKTRESQAIGNESSKGSVRIVQQPNSTSNKNQRNKLDFSLTNSSNNRKETNRRRRPPRPRKTTSITPEQKKTTKSTKSEIQTTHSTIQEIRGKSKKKNNIMLHAKLNAFQYHFYNISPYYLKLRSNNSFQLNQKHYSTNSFKMPLKAN